ATIAAATAERLYGQARRIGTGCKDIAAHAAGGSPCIATATPGAADADGDRTTASAAEIDGSRNADAAIATTAAGRLDDDATGIVAAGVHIAGNAAVGGCRVAAVAATAADAD